MTNVKSFMSQLLAYLKGDDAQAKAERIYRKAKAALKSQLATLEAETLKKQDAVEAATEQLDLARMNHGALIEDYNRYVSNLVNAKNRLTEAEEDLKNHEAAVAFVQDEFDNLEAEPVNNTAQ